MVPFTMSENAGDLSTKFSPEEWNLIESAPFLAGLSVALSYLRTGLFEAIKESLVSALRGDHGIGEWSLERSHPISGRELQGDGGETRTASIPVRVAREKRAEVKAEVAARLAKIPAIQRVWRRETVHGSGGTKL